MASVTIDYEQCEIQAVDANGNLVEVKGIQAREILNAWDGDDPDYLHKAVCEHS